MLPGNQKTRDAANQKTSSEGEDVGHRIKGQTICLAGTAYRLPSSLMTISVG
jgi:hypothetical protein